MRLLGCLAVAGAVPGRSCAGRRAAVWLRGWGYDPLRALFLTATSYRPRLRHGFRVDQDLMPAMKNCSRKLVKCALNAVWVRQL